VRQGLIPTFLELHGLTVPEFEDAKADRKSVSARSALWVLAAKRAVEGMSASERLVRWYYAASIMLILSSLIVAERHSGRMLKLVIAFCARHWPISVMRISGVSPIASLSWLIGRLRIRVI